MDENTVWPMALNDAVKVWMVQAGWNGIRAELFWCGSLVDLPGGNAGPIGPDDTSDEVRGRLELAHPGVDPHPAVHPDRIRFTVNSILRFNREMAVGDIVATYDPAKRLYHTGLITSDVKIYQGGDDSHPHYVRLVRWLAAAARDGFPAPAQEVLEAAVPVFRLDDELARLLLVGAVRGLLK